MPVGIKHALIETYEDVARNHTSQLAAALSYYFIVWCHFSQPSFFCRRLWPYIHWSVAVGFSVLAVETSYFLAPNVKQRLRATLPGAILAVSCWIALSYLLGLY